ncbi:hypothetical protein BDE27_2937 [Xenorhabdus ehlersii]|uniref:Uncharacterized protein n=1 Tax=Xenorhabdus ehlersii TaxID=290111 RepID=A0A2D0IMZ4_9GAMM|nr:hypothetical protein Xehl_02961 [Xenorhabdus ehlersii]RKE89301.1 hypothetical protein BDE27_2937 [Xenorhabdus ehlersii]
MEEGGSIGEGGGGVAVMGYEVLYAIMAPPMVYLYSEYPLAALNAPAE